MQGNFLLLGQINSLSRICACWKWFITSEAKIYLWGNFIIFLMIKLVDFHLWDDRLLTVLLLKISMCNLYSGTRFFLFFLCFGNIVVHQHIPRVCGGVGKFVACTAESENTSISFMFSEYLI